MDPTVVAQTNPKTRKGSKIEFIKDKKRMFCLLTNVQNTTLSDTLQSRTVDSVNSSNHLCFLCFCDEKTTWNVGEKTQLIYCHKVPLISYQRLNKINNISLKFLVEGFVFYSFAPDKREKSSDTPQKKCIYAACIT